MKKTLGQEAAAAISSLTKRSSKQKSHNLFIGFTILKKKNRWNQRTQARLTRNLVQKLWFQKNTLDSRV